MRSRILLVVLAMGVMSMACSLGSKAAETATTVPTVPPAPSDTPAPTEAPAPATDTPTATVAPPAALPAPLYFIAPSSTSDQIWRLERDAETLTQITHAAFAILDFDISPVDGSLAYVSDNTLLKTDALGAGRVELVKGPLLGPIRDESYIAGELTAPRWSPDGAHIAYGLNGINIVASAGGASIVVQQNDPVPQPPDFLPPNARFYIPEAWSPGGDRLLAGVSFWPEAGGLSIFDRAGGGQVDLTSPAGIVCCNPSWSRDGASVYYASPYVGLISSGLWRADAASGESVTLISGESAGTFRLIGWPKQTTDGRLHYFLATTGSFPDGYTPLTMYRAEADGVAGQTQLRTDAYVIAEVLWSSDGSGAAIVDVTASTTSGAFAASGPLLYLKSDGSPALRLADSASVLRWGR